MQNIKRLSFLALMLSFALASLAQDECSYSALKANEHKYDIGLFFECLEGMRPCMSKGGYSMEDRPMAYALIAKCYLAVDSVEQADVYIEKLLRMDENYSTHPSKNKGYTDIIRL
jgi:hypothetical protein